MGESEIVTETTLHPRRVITANAEEVRIYKMDGTLLYEIPMRDIVGVFQSPARREGLFREFLKHGILRFCTEWDEFYGGRDENSTPDSIALDTKDELVVANLVEYVNQHIQNSDKESPYDYVLDGDTSSIYLLDNKILIRHRGLLSGRARDKVIPIAHIVSIKFKRATSGYLGYIQFATTAGELTGGALKAFTDENAVTFSSDQEPYFIEFREHLQAMIDSKSAAPISSNKDPVDQLFKLKGLLDAGILSMDEFESKKKNLLDEI